MPQDQNQSSSVKKSRVTPAAGGSPTPGSVKKPSRSSSKGGSTSTPAGARKKSWAPRP